MNHTPMKHAKNATEHYEIRIQELEAINAELLEALKKLQKGIYDFANIPIEVKNFVYGITTEAICKANEE